MNHTFTPLTIGSTGIGVNKMQAYLNMFQERGLITTKVNQDGDFGAITANAVREFQAYSRLPINGKIDDATWSATNYESYASLPIFPLPAVLFSLRKEVKA